MKVTSNVCLIHIYLNFIPFRNKIKVKVPRLQKSDSYLALSAHFAALKLHAHPPLSSQQVLSYLSHANSRRRN